MIQPTIVNLIKGEQKSPTLATIYQVSDALEISPIEFLSAPIFNKENIEID